MVRKVGRSLAITQTLADRYFSGIERYALNLSEQLRARGHSVSFIVSSRSAALTMIQQQGYPFIAIPVRGDLDPRTSWHVAQALRHLKPDLVNIHDSAAIAPFCCGARLMNLPAVATVHAFHAKWGFLLADHLITVSDAVHDHLRAQGIPAHRLTTVRSGIDLYRYQPRDRRQAQRALGLAPGYFYFAAICRLARRKGLQMLLEAFAGVVRQAPQARLLLAGTGPLEPQFRQQVDDAELTPYVRFLGFFDDVRPVLAASHCVVLPSDREGLGLVLLEAMACARAVIATDAGGPRELVRPQETGLLIPPCERDALQQAMVQVARNPKWIDVAGLLARQTVEQEHSIDRQVDGIEAVYHHLLGKRHVTSDEWLPQHLHGRG